MKQIIDLLKEKNKTISTMESCTGGGVANAITNIEGASEVLRYSAVTYSNEYKIKMGVDEKVIDKYSVYSMETAIEMAKNISNRTNMSAQNRPFSLKATKKTQKVNLQTVVVDGKKVRLSTKEIKSIKKNK